MSHETDSEADGYRPQRDLGAPYLSECLVNMTGLESVIADALGSLRAAIDLEHIVESLPDSGGEAEAERLSDRAMQIREALDDVLPRIDGETWSLRITGVEHDDILPDATMSSSGIATALYKAAQNQAGAIAIDAATEAANESGGASILVDDGVEMPIAELENMSQRLRNMVEAVTETLDKAIPRNDKEHWSVKVEEQAQTLIDNQ